MERLKRCGRFFAALQAHTGLAARQRESERRLCALRDKTKEEFADWSGPSLNIFCAGSLARLEIGKMSDLDIFIVVGNGNKDHSLFNKMIAVNDAIDFPEFDYKEDFHKVHSIGEIKNATGSRRDDNDNLFTTRMLMLLESRAVFSQDAYQKNIREVIGMYCRDDQLQQGGEFRPLFLINDILRYWRTLCLNYEERRSQDLPWRKKNVNLKFSRMLTIFATVLRVIVAKPENFREDMAQICQFSPLQRLAQGLDFLDDDRLFSGDKEACKWSDFLDIYEEFLSWKENESIEGMLEKQEFSGRIRENAEKFSSYLFRALMHDKIAIERKRCLVV